MSRIGKNILRTTVAIAVVVGWLTLSHIGDAKENATQARETLESLLKKQVELTKTYFQLAKTANERDGTITVEDVHKAHLLYLRAKLDLSKSKEDRLLSLNELVRESGNWRDIVATRFQAGRATEMEKLKAEIQFYKASIQFEKAKGGE